MDSRAMEEMQDGLAERDSASPSLGRKRFRSALVAWALVLLCGFAGAVCSTMEGGGEEAMRTILWLPVGVAVLVLVVKGSTVARWMLAMAALVVFAVVVVGVVSVLRSDGSMVMIRVGLMVVEAVCSFHVLRMLIWDVDAKAYVRGRELSKIGGKSENDD